MNHIDEGRKGGSNNRPKYYVPADIHPVNSTVTKAGAC